MSKIKAIVVDVNSAAAAITTAEKRTKLFNKISEQTQKGIHVYFFSSDNNESQVKQHLQAFKLCCKSNKKIHFMSNSKNNDRDTASIVKSIVNKRNINKNQLILIAEPSVEDIESYSLNSSSWSDVKKEHMFDHWPVLKAIKDFQRADKPEFAKYASYLPNAIEKLATQYDNFFELPYTPVPGSQKKTTLSPSDQEFIDKKFKKIIKQIQYIDQLVLSSPIRVLAKCANLLTAIGSAIAGAVCGFYAGLALGTKLGLPAMVITGGPLGLAFTASATALGFALAGAVGGFIGGYKSGAGEALVKRGLFFCQPERGAADKFAQTVRKQTERQMKEATGGKLNRWVNRNRNVLPLWTGVTVQSNQSSQWSDVDNGSLSSIHAFNTEDHNRGIIPTLLNTFCPG